MQTRSLPCQIAFKCIKVQAKEGKTSWAALFDACSAWECSRLVSGHKRCLEHTCFAEIVTEAPPAPSPLAPATCALLGWSQKPF